MGQEFCKGCEDCSNFCSKEGDLSQLGNKPIEKLNNPYFGNNYTDNSVINKDYQNETSFLTNINENMNNINKNEALQIASLYPKKNNKVSQKSKVFLKTNYKTITMPDITGWSSAEVVDFCNIVGLQYNLDGYGYVNTSSIPAGTELNEESVLTVTLQSISPQSLLTEEVKEDGKQEGN